MKAIIQKAKLMRIDEIWKSHKPQGLGFSDNDVVIIELKISGGKVFSQDFYCRLKGDGTLGHSITKRSEKRQKELQSFIKKYISRDKRYDIRNGINTWQGKEVEVDRLPRGFIIKI